MRRTSGYRGHGSHTSYEDRTPARLSAALLAAALVALILAASAGSAAAQSPVNAVESGGSADAAVGPKGVTDVRFGSHATYERAVLDFAGSPGGEPPRYSWGYARGDTVVRVKLPGTRATLETGGPGLGQAISHYRVVRTEPGWLYVDLHLEGAARSVNVFSLDDPGRIVVDVTPGGQQFYPEPANAGNTYVMAPRPGATVTGGEFRVGGYGRPFEASGVWRVKDATGNVVSRGSYTTSDWLSTWGSYSFRAGYPENLAGERGTLEVGSLSPRDGSFTGASLPLRFR